MSRIQIMDAPAALGFVINQRSHIESEIYKRVYPEIRYAQRVPVDTSANAFAPSVTFFNQDSTGRAKFINGKGDDIPLVNITRNMFQQTVNMAGVGYSFSFEEVGAAQQMGMALNSEGAAAARLAYEQLVDEVTHIGDTSMNIEGLFNTTGITSAAAAQTIAAATPDQALATINGSITGIFNATNGIELADTFVLPLAVFGDVTTRRLGSTDGMTVLEFIQKSNVYTARTGQPLNIDFDHRITNRMLTYKKDPSVLKLHMPMPLQFLPPQAVGLEVRVLGAFRFAPVNIRRPAAMRYTTGIA